MIRPTDSLIEGSKVIQQLIGPLGFQFQYQDQGQGSGGAFAWGEFVRDDRRLEIHFRHTLGLVSYHIGDESASHKAYMSELGVWEQCLYPGFSEDPITTFHELAHDLGYAGDFLSGSGDLLRMAAAKEASETANQQENFMASAVGDTRRLTELRDQFQKRDYGKVIFLAAELKYPDRMSQSERRMVEIARERADSGGPPKS